MAPPTQAAIPVTARVRPTLTLSSVSEIELRYDGAEPPLELLDELARLGWEGATPCPPPAHAIDWSAPDPVRGTRHSIRSFDGMTTACLRGSERHRAAGVEQARIVLARHGLLPDGDRAEAPTPAPAPTKLAVSSETTAPTTVRVELIVAPGAAIEVRARASRLGTVELEEPDVWTASTTYKGRTATRDRTARRFVLAVPADRHAELLVALSSLRPWAMRRLLG